MAKAHCVLLLVVHLALASSEAPHIDPTYDDKLGKQGTLDPGSQRTDVITCKLKDCEPMCVCQKLVWELYMRPGLEKQPATTMCNEWAETKRMEDKCIPKCVALAHNVYAVAGADENICLSAVAEVRLTIPKFKAVGAELVHVAPAGTVASKRRLKGGKQAPALDNNT